MKIVAISDIHNHNPTLPDGDVLIIAGDSTNLGKPTEIALLNAWLSTVKHQFKHGIYVLAGNHDMGFMYNKQLYSDMLTNATYVEDECVNIEGYVFYFSPWTPTFHNWAFMLPRGEEIKKKWDAIPDNTQILVTHGPPFGILDKNLYGNECGCEELNKRVQQLAELKVHIFGHIHVNNKANNKIKRENVLYVNASICNDNYSPVNLPNVIDLEAL